MAISSDATFVTRLRRGETAIGTVVTLGSVALAELTADGLDFVWLDLEHGALDVADVQPLAVAARAAGCGALVRLTGTDDFRLSAVLDAGVDGVALPRVESAARVGGVAERLRYPPHGQRGYAARRSLGYGRRPDPSPHPVLMAQVETSVGVREAHEIAAVPGVDALVVGCADLALDLGGTPDPRSPLVREAIAAVQDAADRAGIASGIAGPDDPSLLRELSGGQSTVFVCSADVRTYARAVGAQVASVREASRAAT